MIDTSVSSVVIAEHKIKQLGGTWYYAKNHTSASFPDFQSAREFGMWLRNHNYNIVFVGACHIQFTAPKVLAEQKS
jgi:hypothetical protein